MADFLISVVPSAGVLFLFVVVVRALLQADRRERVAQARIEAEQDRAAASAAQEAPQEAPQGPAQEPAQGVVPGGGAPDDAVGR